AEAGQARQSGRQAGDDGACLGRVAAGHAPAAAGKTRRTGGGGARRGERSAGRACRAAERQGLPPPTGARAVRRPWRGIRVALYRRSMKASNGFALALAACIIATTAISPADAARRARKQKQPEEAAPASVPVDKRDRTVTAPGSPFNGRAYWQAVAQ